ncbi:NAD-binding domain and a Fe-S cluster-containing protein [Spirosoma endophyticum]|uniref:NAD-binding domain and a Fe-S cluster-containing protein n=2 Tax=Spirosoma endophyticum TaxID=662367 RepID=A0A1I2HVK8_9BACT|nr:NAD-binding domain and a Fe-S cluster-containing protein [Spirosoma endophyticum]
MGGGVAGLSAAHELLKRGYEVTIIEKRETNFGGKARSIDYHPSQTRLTLPAEHGFRFFPGFYGNITRTMKEIKLHNNKTVFDNLVPVSYYTFLFTDDRKPVNVPVNIGHDVYGLHFGKAMNDLKALQRAFDDGTIDVSDSGRDFFIKRLFELFTACEERYLTEYERIPWEEFIEANNPNYGKDYKQLLAEGLTKNLVACRADKACTRTGGKILAHMIWQIINPFGTGADRVLNAPTNEAWLIPWVSFLKKTYPNTFTIESGKRVMKLDVKKKAITRKNDFISWERNTVDSISINDANDVGSAHTTVIGNNYIAAIPIERLSRLLNDSKLVVDMDPTLKLVEELAKQVEWMSGMVFYLNKDVQIADAHVTIANSGLAITIFSQTQYWQTYLQANPLPSYQDKPIKSILSIIVSDWNAKGILYPKICLKEMTHNQVILEVWSQLKCCTIFDSKSETYFKLTDDDCFLSLTFIDESIVNDRNRPGHLFNKEPLLVNTIVTNALRPDSHTRVDNLYLAADFVRTHSDLADMDTANEAARKAVNNILDKDGRKSEFCKTATYVLPTLLGLFSLARRFDKRNFQRGLPWRPFSPLLHFFNYSFIFFARVIKLPRPLILLSALLYLIVLAIILIINFLISVILNIFRF